MADKPEMTPEEKEKMYENYDSNASKKFTGLALGSKPKFNLDIGKIPGVVAPLAVDGDDEIKPTITPSNQLLNKPGYRNIAKMADNISEMS